MFDTVTITLFFVVLTVYWFMVGNRHTTKKFPPAPRWSLPVLGDALVIGGNITEGFAKLHDKYGRIFGCWLGPQETVVVNDFDLIQEIGSREELIARPDFPFFAELRGGYGKNHAFPGVLMSSGQTWEEQRRFTLKTLRDLGFGKNTNEELVTEEVNMLCSVLERFGGKPVNIRNDFNIAILNALWAIVTGERLSPEDPKAKKIIQVMDQFLQEFTNPVNMLVYTYKPLTALCNSLNIASSGKETAEHLVNLMKETAAQMETQFQEDSLRTFGDHYINEIRKQTESTDGKSTFSGEEGQRNFINVLVDLFIAGSETTSTTLNWAMFYMLKHPDICKKVQDELDSVFGPGQSPAAHDRDKTPYTEAVLQEIQRMGNILNLSVVHATDRECELDGYRIPKGSQVFCNIGAILHNPSYFPNPDKFDPSRYLTKEGKFCPHPKMVAFGLGRRRCLGETLARLELYMFFTGILSRFDLKKEDESDALPYDPIYGSVVSPKPYNMRFVPRY